MKSPQEKAQGSGEQRRRRPPIMRIAHRGASGTDLAPENTLASIEKALQIGVDLVEIDIHLTADGHPVVIHDKTLNRTTNGSGAVESLTLSQIRKLDAGSWFDPAFRGERIPTLSEVLDLVKGRALILLETKTEEAARQAVTAIRSRKAQSEVIIQSFFGSTLRVINQLDRRIPTAFLMVGGEATLRRNTGVIRRVLKLGANALSLQYKAARPGLAHAFLARGLGFWVWTADREDDMRKLISLGVGGIITNFPDRLNRVLEDGRLQKSHTVP